MANEELVKILEQGVEAWNAWRKDTIACGADLSGANLSGSDFSRANLSGVNLRGTHFQMADLSGAELNGAGLNKANLCDAKLIGASFHRADLRKAILFVAELNGADLRGANLSGSDLSGASLLGVVVDASTTFVDEVRETDGAETIVNFCEIDSYALKMLDNYGGLTTAQRASMIVKNDLADLRASYSGLQLWIHLFALAVFFLPYAWFLTIQYGKAKFAGLDGAEAITLWEALGRFIWNGGKNWQAGWDFDWSFLAFVFLAIYNFGRGVLLWQTNRLEQREHVTGVPVRFSLAVEPFWRRLIKTMAVLFWIGLGVLAVNTYHFMSQKVPILP